MKTSKLITISTFLLTTFQLFAQPADWKYFRTSNTGVAGDYHHVIEIDKFNNKWTAGYEPFWGDGSVVKYNDVTWKCWSNFEGYIPDDRVNAIAFDTLNRVWAGTDEGLAFFDGTNWTQYTSANTPLPFDHIYGVAVDAANNLWATYGDVNFVGGGVARFNGNNWTLYEPGSSGLPSSEVTQIDIDSEGNIWIASNLGIIKYDGFNWITYTVANSQLTSNNVMSLFVDDQDRVWAGSNSAVDVLDGTTWQHYSPANTPMNSGADIFDIAVSGNKIIFANSVPGGADALIVFNGTSWKYVPTPNWPISVAIDNLGNFWTCGIGHVSMWDGVELTVYSRYNTGLAENFNNDVFVDSQNRQWFANGNGGIQIFDCPLWEAYGPWNEGHFPIPIDYTTIGTSITEDPFGDIWMAYDGVAGGIVQIPNGDVHSPDNWIVWENDNADVNIQFIEHIVSDDEGNIWVALDGGGVSVYWHQLGTWQNFNTSNSPLITNYVTDISFSGGSVWIANYYLTQYTDGVWKGYSPMDMGLVSWASVLTAEKDNAGNLWVGTSEGLTKYNGAAWTVYNVSNSGIAGNSVNAIEFGNADTLFVAAYNVSTWPYYGGFSVFDGNNFVSYTDENSPLAHKQVEDLELDKLGNLWILTQSEGMTVFRKGGLIGFECIDLPPGCSLTATITPAVPTTFCKPGSVTLNAPVNAGYTYQWKKNGAMISGATNAFYTATKSGNYMVEISDESCNGSSAEVAVTASNKPDAVILNVDATSDLCFDNSIKLKATPNGAGFTYKWRKNNTVITGATNKTYFATTPGSYTVKITNANGCSNTSPGYQIVETCRLEQGTTNEDVLIYPNPAQSEFTIELPAVNQEDDAILVIKNMIGEEVYSAKINSQQEKVQLTNKVADGVYLVEVHLKDMVITKQIIIQR